MAIIVKGRPRRQWIVRPTALKGFLSIRIDDADDEEFWEEILIPETDLLALLAKVHRVTHAPDTVEELDGLDEVAGFFGLTPSPTKPR